MKKPPDLLLNFALALLSAILLILTFPNIAFVSTGLSFLAPVALTPLLIALFREPRPLWRFLLGEFTGIVYWFGICYWIQFVLEVHGGMGRWGGWATFMLFCVAKALHLAVFSLLAAIVMRAPLAIPAVAALWTGIERTHPDLGFAWLALGNAAIDMPLPARIAPYLGVYGISFLFAITAATFAQIVLRRARQQLWWLAIIPLCLLLPDLPKPATPSESALIVQTNMPEEAEWTPQSAGAARDHFIKLSLDKALETHPRLIIWPEVPGPIYYYRDPALHQQAADLARAAHAGFLFGTVAETPQGAPLNSAVMLRPGGEFADRYDKIHLVPFGEFVPPLFGFVNRITQEAGDFVPGNRIVVFPVDSHGLGAFICYESVFPEEVREFVKSGANVLANISNDGYFGRSAAREQHLEIVRMRALENRRWILRATNDGISVAIDPAGRVTERFPMYQEVAETMGYSYVSGTTFYTEHGDWFAWLCLFAAAVFLVMSQWPHYIKESRREPRRPNLRR